MAATYTLISSNVLSSSAASVTFSAIPSTYTDLVLRMSTRSSDSGNSTVIQVTFNGDTATNYSTTLVGNYAGTALSVRTTSASFSRSWTEGTILTANTFTNNELYIPSYTASQNKPLSSFDVLEDNTASGYVLSTAALWRNTAAINSMTLTNSAGNFVSGSSFYLYGLRSS